ncbi:hypothetical protein [Dongia deserti]|uniref:hypothetical protein n=1 Tax=Dongia deserti TaxID=2268030 RepID=UPI000E651D71|nr:hypothetical protein [Dongia deserti]
MNRGLKLAGTALLLSAGVALAACSSTGDEVGSQFAGCTGGYPDGGGITDMSPYSTNPGSFQPDCEGRG